MFSNAQFGKHISKKAEKCQYNLRSPPPPLRWPLRSLRFLPVYTACKRTRVRTLETRAHTTHMHTRACSHHAHAHARALTRAFSPHAGPQPADTRARGVGTRPVTASGWGVAGKGGESRIAPPSTLRERQAPEASALNLSAPRKEWAAGKAAASPTDVRTQTSCPLIASSAHGTWAGGSEHAQSAPCAQCPQHPQFLAQGCDRKSVEGIFFPHPHSLPTTCISAGSSEPLPDRPRGV